MITDRNNHFLLLIYSIEIENNAMQSQQLTQLRGGSAVCGGMVIRMATIRDVGGSPIVALRRFERDE